MKVRATEDGFYQGSIIKAGTVFEFDGVKLGKWMAPVDSELSKKEKKAIEKKEATTSQEKPVALSELNPALSTGSKRKVTEEV